MRVWIATDWFGTSVYSAKPVKMKNKAGEEYWIAEMLGGYSHFLSDAIKELIGNQTIDDEPVEVELKVTLTRVE